MQSREQERLREGQRRGREEMGVGGKGEGEEKEEKTGEEDAPGPAVADFAGKVEELGDGDVGERAATDGPA